MRILHYALGFPPYRSGGLTKWCVDLMIQQAKEGHCVAMLWPGQMGMLNKKIAIKKQQITKPGTYSHTSEYVPVEICYIPLRLSPANQYTLWI